MKIIDNTTVQVNASYVEGTKSSDGSAMSDLAYSSVYYKVSGGPTVVGAKTPASKPAGGGVVAVSLIVPAPSGVKTSIDFWGTETDLQGNESVPTPVSTFVIERMAPEAPLSFTVA